MTGTNEPPSSSPASPKSPTGPTRWPMKSLGPLNDREPALRARWPFRAFFFTAAAVYTVLAVAHVVDNASDVWPGDQAWGVVYALAAVGSFAAGCFEAKVVSGPRRWWWSLGLAITPALFAFRLVLEIADHGVDALEVSLLSVWTAAGLVWAVHLIRLLPASGEEWDGLADEVRVLRRDIADLQDHVGLNTDRIEGLESPPGS